MSQRHRTGSHNIDSLDSSFGLDDDRKFHVPALPDVGSKSLRQDARSHRATMSLSFVPGTMSSISPPSMSNIWGNASSLSRSTENLVGEDWARETQHRRNTSNASFESFRLDDEDPLVAAKARLTLRRMDQDQKHGIPSKLSNLAFSLETDASQPGSANSELEDNLARTLDMLGLDEQRQRSATLPIFNSNATLPETNLSGSLRIPNSNRRSLSLAGGLDPVIDFEDVRQGHARHASAFTPSRPCLPRGLEDEMSFSPSTMHRMDSLPRKLSPGDASLAVPIPRSSDLETSSHGSHSVVRSVSPEAPISKSPGNSEGVSRSIWIAGLDPNITVADVSALLAPYGALESVRMFSERDAAVVNFVKLEDAIAAKRELDGVVVGRLRLRVSFGRADRDEPDDRTKSVWIGSLVPMETRDFEALVKSFGSVESYRLLPAKNCAFVNYHRLEDAVEAKRQLAGKEHLGQILKTGFAREPNWDNPETRPEMFSPRRRSSGLLLDSDPFSSQVTPAEASAPIPQGREYSSAVPLLPDASKATMLDPAFLKDMRRRVETAVARPDFDAVFEELLPEAQFISSDYFGNIVMQRLVEKSSASQRLRFLDQVGPWLASLGTHKNGTYVVQKLLNIAESRDEFAKIQQYLEPYTPPLLLDQFGNYVVQCCLRFGTEFNQFIYDAMTSRCVEVGNGRYGARSVRTCLESPFVTKLQQKQVAIAIVQNAMALIVNPNGTLLLNWLLDNSALPGRFRVLVPRLLPQLAQLCCNKLASNIIIKLIAQRTELDARELIMDALFFSSQKGGILDNILSEYAHGVPMIQKMLASPWLDMEERTRVADFVRLALYRMGQELVRNRNVGLKRLMDELCLIPVGSQDAAKVVEDLQRLGLYVGLLPGQEIPPALQQTLLQHQAATQAAAIGYDPYAYGYGAYWPAQPGQFPY